MTTKMYLHDAATADTGTLPSTALTPITIDITASGASTNRSMDTNIGALQVAPTLATHATTSQQSDWFRRFVSSPLAAQTIGSAGGGWALHYALKTSNASNSAFSIGTMWLGVWRPSTGAVVGTAIVTDMNDQGLGATASEAAVTNTISGTGTVSCADGDILVLEVGGRVTQGMATSYTWTFYYDGTVEDSATDNAAYLLSPTTLTFSTGAAFVAPEPLIIRQDRWRTAYF